MPFVQVDPSQLKFDAPQLAGAPSGFVRVDPSKIQFDKPAIKSSFDSAMGDIGSNAKENLYNTFTSTGEAISEPLNNPNAKGAMAIPDAIIRTIGKAGNALGGVYGTIAAIPHAALTASVENSGVIPAIASAVKSNLVPDDPRFTANISPDKQHQIAQGIGGDLTNAFFMGAGGLKGAALARQKAGLPPLPAPYNPITETIAPAINKLETALQSLPGMAGNTASGVSVNGALGGIPDAVAIRAKGALAMSPDSRAEVSQKNWDTASNLFKRSTSAGAVIHDSSAQNLLNTVKQAIGGLNSRTSDTAGVLADFEEAIKNGNVTPDKLHEFRQNFADVISSNTKSKIDGGGVNLDGKKALIAKNAISEVMAQLTGADLSKGSPQAISDMLEGINKTAQAYRFDRVAQMLDDAQSDPNAIQRGAIKLLKNTNGYNAEEIAALKTMSKRGLGQQIERGVGTFGFDTGKLKNVALPTLVKTGALAVPGGVPLVGAGTILRQTGKLAARGLGQEALDAIMSRDTSPPAIPPSPPAPAPFSPAGLLPAPQTTMVVNPYGQAVPLTPVGREIIGEQVRPAPNPTLQEIMKMKPADARAALETYQRNRNYRR